MPSDTWYPWAHASLPCVRWDTHKRQLANTTEQSELTVGHYCSNLLVFQMTIGPTTLSYINISVAVASIYHRALQSWRCGQETRKLVELNPNTTHKKFTGLKLLTRDQKSSTL